MHGLINRAIQCFVRDSYGQPRWVEVCRLADVDTTDFEAMLHYEDSVTEDLIKAASEVIGAPLETVLEDIGTYLVTHPNVEALRRLLRFGGVDFVDFLHSLDDLPERARLAVDDLILPSMELREHSSECYSLTCRHPQLGFGHVMIGILRTMADDYGALVFLEHKGAEQDAEVVDITLVVNAFASGREFELGARAQ
ncbi:heme NO-binding domain-containing protein [Shimia sp. R9_1]|uniref:heme NO-binding domain-containing protein n=1 Tax=unclassified Shimia TaxID=2630038 RepID=UPI001AD9AF62|nr:MULTISPECIES: heme NO-binding domain-containing protein [unclassified Shimia]MBO9396240.1 heme NO-binding domain-containing protein [Shimia sp. R9_2]MBO9406085.1 heme NO-binding domain-containing protein [Shimia sp. R9_1]